MRPISFLIHSWKIVERNVPYAGCLKQKDTYYLVGVSRLKVREETNQTHVIYYKRANTEQSKDSRYFIVSVPKSVTGVVKTVFKSVFGSKKVVEKQRDLYVHENTRIHLDSVKNLGEFLELETVVGDERKYADYTKEHEDVINMLGLNLYPKIAMSYSDLEAGSVAVKGGY